MQVRWTKLAQSQLRAIYEFILHENPAAALQQVHRIEDAVVQLSQFPETGRPGRVADTRELVVPRTEYIVAYIVRKSAILILAIHHGAQLWPQTFRRQK